MVDKILKTDKEWQQELTPEQYRVMRQKGTEPAFAGQYVDVHDKGTYHCAACGQELFSSDTKFDSGTGWPSFYAPLSEDSVSIEGDTSHGMERDEVVCSRCGAHLGHVFSDGPQPTCERYCMNSISLSLHKD
jgi:peptide-methionine (R)-S-oxide reductase